ncbi:MAG: hypothetical protein ABSD71_07465 [Bacteroidales bacterium]|jgi:shikimate kinase
MNQYLFDKIIENYRLNIENQHAQYNLLITILSGAFLLLLTINWYWNNHRITEKIKSLEEQARSIRDIINSDTSNFFKQKEKEIVETFYHQQTTIDQLAVAIFSVNSDNTGGALFFLCRSMDIFRMQNDQINLRKSVELLLQFISHDPLASVKKVYNLNDVKKFVNNIPDMLNREREVIKSFLEGCVEFSTEVKL